MADQRAEWTAGLRTLADLTDRCPEAKAGYVSIYHPVSNVEELRSVVKALGGRWTKGSNVADYTLERDLGGGVKYFIYATHEAVCKRNVVGTKEKKVEVPVNAERALELQNELMSMETREETVQEDVVEWTCPTILGVSED